MKSSMFSAFCREGAGARRGRRWKHESQVMEDVTRWVAGATDLVVDALYKLQDELADLRHPDAGDRAAQSHDGDDARGFDAGPR